VLLIQRENSDEPAAGTSLAILYESKSSASRSGWGGARNSASRTTDFIRLHAALNLIESARSAISVGLPFNRHLTVHWALGGIPDSRAAQITGRLVKLIADWVKKGGGQFAYLWVRETGNRKGTHVHILLHLPKGLQFGQMTRRWTRRLMGKAPRGAVLTKAIGGSANAAFSGSGWYEDNLASVVAYLLKGVSEEAGEALGLDKTEAGGRIIGKRSAVSQNIGSARRKCLNGSRLASGIQPKSSLESPTAGVFEQSFRIAENHNFADDLGKSGEAV